MPVKVYHERYLLEAVDSMLHQTCAAWRLLIIVEQPGVAELSRVLAAALADPRIELVVNRGRKLAGALNTGMRAAQTEFVAILLGDDLWAPSAVEVLTREIASFPDADFLHSARRIIDEHGEALSSVYASRPNVSAADFLHSSPVKHLLCWRRALGLRIGGMDESLNSIGVDDYDFPWSMADSGATFKAVADCLYIYRDHRTCFRLTTHLPISHHKREIARIMRKHGADRPAITARVGDAERTYLRQCLFRSRAHRWITARRPSDAGGAWRETYR